MEDDDVAAIGACTRLIEKSELGPGERATAHYYRGNAHWRRHAYDQAIDDENNAIGISPRYAEAYISRGGPLEKKTILIGLSLMEQGI